MQTEQSVVTWHYADRPVRWVIAIIALLAAVGTTGTMFYQLPASSSENASQVSPDFLTQWSMVAFSIVVVVVCLRQRVDGYFVRRGGIFEVDTGRSAPNVLAPLSLFFELVRPSSWLKADLASLSSQCWRCLLPLRRHLKGRVDEIESITLEPSRVGVNAVLHINGTFWTVAEDIPVQEADRLRKEIETAIEKR